MAQITTITKHYNYGWPSSQRKELVKMHLLDLLTKCEMILGQARFQAESDNLFRAIEELVKLRELLNSQPELEAGGVTRKETTEDDT